MRLAIVNDVYAADAPTAEALLARYPTLTGWADAVAAEGVSVAVFQRFHRDGSLRRGAVAYTMGRDPSPPIPPRTFAGSPALLDAIVRFSPDVVHVNGLDFPLAIRRLRRVVPQAAIAVQDHGGFDPRRLRPPRRLWMRFGLRAADALLVAAPGQIDEFRASGLVPDRVRLFDVVEGSSTLRVEQRRPRQGGPALLWVGRLNANKDPLTVLAGFAQFLAAHPGATLTFVYQDAALESAMAAAVDASGQLRSSVVLRGRIAKDRLVEEYAAADHFVLGSHRESTGYAALEALACGVPPVVTDIASFRWLTDGGAIGALWTPGDPASFCRALERAAAKPIDVERAACRRRFDALFAWPAIGRRAAGIYERLWRT